MAYRPSFRLLFAWSHLSPRIQLLSTALLSALAYLFSLAWTYPLLPLYAIPQLDLGKIDNYEAAYAIRLIGSYVLIFGLYLHGYRTAARLNNEKSFWLILCAAIGFAVILLWVYPIGAIDIFDYIFRARLWAVYNFNPLTVAPMQVSEDPWYSYIVWVWYGSPYGPLWTYLSLILYQLAGDDLLRNLLAFKLLPSACIIACSVMIYDLLRGRGTGAALSGVLLFAWNPLLLFESVVNGHNDIVMITFVVFALWLYQRRHFQAAVIVCLLATFIKIAAAPLVPVFWLAGLTNQREVRARWRYLLTSTAIGLSLSVVIYAPLWAGAMTFEGIKILDERFTSSLAAITVLSLEPYLGATTAAEWVRNSFTLIFAIVYGWRLQSVSSSELALQESVFTLLVLLLLIATQWFQPWYVTWVIALAPLMKDSHRSLAVLWSASALSTYIVFDYLWFWQPEFFNTGDQLVLNIIVLLLWLGPLGLSEAIRYRRSILPKAFLGSITE